MSLSVAKKCAEQLFDYMDFDRKPYPEELGGDAQFEHLFDYAYEWLWIGDGARVCGNDFSIWMATVALAATEWPRLSYAGRPPEKKDVKQALPTIVASGLWRSDEANCYWCANVFDPWFFQQMVANPELGRRQLEIKVLVERGESRKVKELEPKLNSAPWAR